MKGFVSVFAVMALAAAAQETPGAGRIIGVVTALEAGTRQITVKADAGPEVAVQAGERAVFLRVPPGEKDLKRATRIALGDIGVGDRVLARGALSADGKSLAATSVIVMTKTDIAAKHAADAAEWQRRGAAGIITALNPDAHEVTLSVGPREAGRTLTVETAGATEFRRYAPDSVRFSDARPSAFADLKTGDQVRVLGERAAEDGRMKAEQVVSGSFRNIAAQIKSVNAAANEIQTMDLETRKPLIIRVNSDSLLRRMPPMMANMLAQHRQAGAGVRTDAAPPAGGGPPRGRGGDFQQMLERMPPATLAELKPGDAVVVSSTTGADPTRVTAIVLVAGVEPLLASAPQGGASLGGGWNFEIPLP